MSRVAHVETLLLPGMDGTGRLFARLQCELAPELQARVVAFPIDHPQTYEELLEELPRPTGPFAVVAESFSGPLAIRLAARHSDRVRALVLVATFVRAPSMVARLAKSIGRRLFEHELPDLALRLALTGMDATADELAEVRAAISSVDPGVMAARIAAVASVDVSRDFAQDRTPTLYIAGRRDRLVGAGVMAHMKTLRPDMETAILAAPHLVLQRRPAESGRLISEFVLARLAAASSNAR